MPGVCADTDVWGLYRGQVRWGFGVLHLEEGNLLGREVKVLAAGAEGGREGDPLRRAAAILRRAGAQHPRKSAWRRCRRMRRLWRSC